MSTLIKNGVIVTAEDIYKGDIYVEDEIITEIGLNIPKKADVVIDAEGKYVIPGGIDIHTHLNIHVGEVTASDDFYTGTVAAACGGTTCIVDHMGFGPKDCDLMHQVKVYHGYADGKAVIDYGFHGVIQHIDDNRLEELKKLVIEEGIPSSKMYLTYDFRLSDYEALRLLKRQKELGGITAVHCENNDSIKYLKEYFIKQGKTQPIYHALSRPTEVEGEAVNRMINLAKIAGDAPLYIVHLSTEIGLEYIKMARDRGQMVYAETCPQYLFLTEDKLRQPDGLKYIFSPPLRKEKDSTALWSGIKDGYIQTVATDHCPFFYKGEKQFGKDSFADCPNGGPGIEERIPLMFSEGVVKGRISINKFVDICSTAPAKISGLYPKKGHIAVGSDADMVLIDANKEVTITKDILHENVDYTMYEGFKVKGYPVLTMVRGEIIARNGQFVGKKGYGKFIKRHKINQL
ncbi:dihydropyrimidinase [Clostridium sp. Mt-5]|uniref:Dihydropyrimidinase n=1 Tax=Clostridium moutaii TaxID=3240932 RepID=A0ABV4BPW4_9CLOT